MRRAAPLNPAPFHRTNVWLHLLNTALVFWLALRLRAGTWGAAAAALLFAIHPLHVESVAWISSRKDVLYSAFFLGGLLIATAAFRQGKWYYWAGVFVLFLLSLLSKPAAIVFPPALWLIHWYEQPQAAIQPKRLVYLLPFLAFSLISVFITFAYQEDIGAVDQQYGFGKRFLFASYSAVIYLWKCVFPFGLSAFHPAPLANEALSGRLYAAPLLAIGLAGATVWAFFKKRLLFFALAFYWISLLLVLGFVKLGSSLYAERYTYMAYTGIFIAVGTLLQQALSAPAAWKKGLAIGLTALFVALFAWQTARQIPVWKDAETLWTQVLQQYPSDKNYGSRGYHFYLTRQWEKALRDFEKATALNPANETALQIQGICWQKLNKYDEAIRVYEDWLKKFKASVAVTFELGNAYMAQKNAPAAVEAYTKTLALQPEHLDALNNRAGAWFQLKEYAKAEADYSTALAIRPDFIAALNNRGAARLNSGNRTGAANDFRKSLALQPDQPVIRDYLSKTNQ
jgi:tetratricopeptide (TPR) repeat protein